MLADMLKERGVEEIPACDPVEWTKIREEYKKVLCREEYGDPVPAPTEEWFEEKPMGYYERTFCGGKANYKEVVCHTVVNGKPFAFPFFAIYPAEEGRYPFFVNCDFQDGLQGKYTPTEEIIDNGFAMFLWHYEKVTTDDVARDFTNGLAGIVTPPGERAATATGKLQMWAWANSRILDYALQQSYVIPESAAVIGLSRLGKTALVTGMMDERFRFVISTGAGCSGDALTRGKISEGVAWITDKTRETRAWFCPNYYKYVDMSLLHFDQHMLLATIAPRTLIIGAAKEDAGADPVSQYLSCYAASRAWKNLGKTGLVGPDRLPQEWDEFHEGDVCFHMRPGYHYQTRYDWQVYMAVVKEKLGIAPSKEKSFF